MPFTRYSSAYEISKRQLCESLILDKVLVEKLKNEHYDVYLTAAYDGCTFGFYHMLGIRCLIGFNGFAAFEGALDMLGIPRPSSFVTSKTKN